MKGGVIEAMVRLENDGIGVNRFNKAVLCFKHEDYHHILSLIGHDSLCKFNYFTIF